LSTSMEVRGSREPGLAGADCPGVPAEAAALAADAFAGGFSGGAFAVAPSMHGTATASRIPAACQARLVREVAVICLGYVTREGEVLSPWRHAGPDIDTIAGPRPRQRSGERMVRFALKRYCLLLALAAGNPAL